MGRNASFDLIKGLACIAVVLIHYNYSGNLGLAIKSICRFAVPSFLCITGYFLGADDGYFSEEKVVRKIRDTLSLIFGASVFYATFTVLYNSYAFKGFSPMAFAMERMTAGKIVKFFLTNDPFAYAHLWYLLAVVYCYGLVLLLGPRKTARLTPLLVPTLVVGYSCLQEFGVSLGISRSFPLPGSDQRIYLFNLFIFRALPFFLFGYWLRNRGSRLAVFAQHSQKDVLAPFLAAGAILGGCFSVFEHFCFGEAQFYVGNYISVLCLFTLALRHPNAKGALVTIGRDLSLYMYIFHIAVGKVVDLSAGKLHVNKSVFYVATRPFIVLFTSLLFACLACCVQKKIIQKKHHAKEKVAF